MDWQTLGTWGLIIALFSTIAIAGKIVSDGIAKKENEPYEDIDKIIDEK